jgi:multiple sugar transport system permease protein
MTTTTLRQDQIAEAQAQATIAKLRRIVSRLAVYVLMSFLGFFFLFPIIFMLVASLKPPEQVIADLDSIHAFVPTPSALTFNNYTALFDNLPFDRYMFNSIFVVSTTVIGGLIFNSMAAYVLARIEWVGRRLILAIIISLTIIPFEAIAVPLMLQVNSLPWFGSDTWLNSYHVQIIPFWADTISIFLFYQFFIGIPKDFDEAARVDGAGPFRIYWNIIVPLSRPVFATVAILQFLQHWSSFMWPLMVTRGDQYSPLMVGMQTLYTQAPLQWGQIMAYASMVTVPVLIIFLLFQSWFVKSVSSSGVKG